MIRGGEPGDAPRLAALYRESVMRLGPTAYDPAQVAAWARYPDDDEAFAEQLASGLLRVAEVDGAPAAFGLLEENDHVALLYCHPGHARRGLASRILHDLESHARAAGQVVISTDASRVSRPFFEHHGYHLTGREEVVRHDVTLERFHLSKCLIEPAATRWLILGNSASGKSTLANRIASIIGGAALDLDPIAWQPGATPPVRSDPTTAHAAIDAFTRRHPAWVIEGCYEDLIAHAAAPDTVLVLLDPGVETCLERAANRDFEPHKFPTPEAQQAALEFLKSWIADYPHRTGPLSRAAHLAVFASHPGPKFHVPPAEFPATIARPPA